MTPLLRRAPLGLLGLLLALPARAADAPQLYQDSYDLEVAQDYAGALAKMDALRGHGETYVYHLRRGWLLYLLGRYADAAAAYEAAVGLAPSSVEARQGWVLPLMALKRWPEAAAVCEDILRLAPADYRGQSRLAYIDHSRGRYAAAAARYQALLDQYPSDVEMRTGLGWALLKDGQVAAAQEAFAAVLAIAPNHASAAQGLAAAR